MPIGDRQVGRQQTNAPVEDDIRRQNDLCLQKRKQKAVDTKTQGITNKHADVPCQKKVGLFEKERIGSEFLRTQKDDQRLCKQ